uniref:Apoaequorin n=1 Tax=Aequorea macrodactyla TaxID=147615 RepID=Q8WQY7_9CNID|nr:apoaequorin [Aequorea macrodactyla]
MTSKYAVKLEPDFENPKWVGRHKHMFKFLDVNQNGKISLDEMVYKASDIVINNLGATPEQAKRHKDAVEAFFGGAGMKYGVETEWPEYIEGWKNLARTELDRFAKNQITLIRLWGDALFDIIDKDQNGAITLDEWKKYTLSAGIIQSAEDCEITFKVCDLDDSGRLDADEMTRQHIGFWYTMDPACEKLYGGAVP